jgi:hypothetical protein
VGGECGQKAPCYRGNLVDRIGEAGGVGLRRLGHSTDFADVLERGRANLFVSRRRRKMVKNANVAAHGEPRSASVVDFGASCP